MGYNYTAAESEVNYTACGVRLRNINIVSVLNFSSTNCLLQSPARFC